MKHLHSEDQTIWIYVDNLLWKIVMQNFTKVVLGIC